MPNTKSAQEDSLSPEDLVSKARELSIQAIKFGNEKLIVSARELENDITDYVHKKGRKANVYRAFSALSELINNSEFRKSLTIEFIVKIMVEIFLHL